VFLSLVIIALILPSFNQIANKEFDLQMLMAPQSGILWGLGIVIVAILTGLFAGSYPALFLSSLNPTSSLKSDVATGKSGSGLRKTLVVLQFVISVVLIIGTAVVYKQLQFIQNVNLGYNRDNIVYTYMPGDKSEIFSNELREQPGIINVGLSNRHPAYILSSTSGFGWPGKNPDETILFHTMGVDENYMATMDMEIIDGRQFLNTDSAVVMINERAREIMGLNDPVGQIITAMGDREIVGVVKDFNFKSIHTAIEPIVIFKLPELNRVYIRFDPAESENIVATIGGVWSKLLPDREFDYYFLDEDFDEMYKAEQRTSKLSTYFAVLAILISCLGLFGLVSYATEQRTKEVGIRKVLGASVRNIFGLLTGDFVRLVAVSLVVSIPIGWYAMDKWLTGFAYHIDLSAWIFIFSGIAALAITLLTVSYQSIRVSISNPVHALRSE
jgi:ABC-type antimicrobial peptide transport system permease subunit